MPIGARRAGRRAAPRHRRRASGPSLGTRPRHESSRRCSSRPAPTGTRWRRWNGHRFAVLTGAAGDGQDRDRAHARARARTPRAGRCTSASPPRRGLGSVGCGASPALRCRRRVRLDRVPARCRRPLGARARPHPPRTARRPALADLDVPAGAAQGRTRPDPPRARRRALPAAGAGARRRPSALDRRGEGADPLPARAPRAADLRPATDQRRSGIRPLESWSIRTSPPGASAASSPPPDYCVCRTSDPPRLTGPGVPSRLRSTAEIAEADRRPWPCRSTRSAPEHRALLVAMVDQPAGACPAERELAAAARRHAVARGSRARRRKLVDRLTDHFLRLVPPTERHVGAPELARPRHRRASPATATARREFLAASSLYGSCSRSHTPRPAERSTFAAAARHRRRLGRGRRARSPSCSASSSPGSSRVCCSPAARRSAAAPRRRTGEPRRRASPHHVLGATRRCSGTRGCRPLPVFLLDCLVRRPTAGPATTSSSRRRPDPTWAELHPASLAFAGETGSELRRADEWLALAQTLVRARPADARRRSGSRTATDRDARPPDRRDQSARRGSPDRDVRSLACAGPRAGSADAAPDHAFRAGQRPGARPRPRPRTAGGFLRTSPPRRPRTPSRRPPALFTREHVHLVLSDL